MHTAHALKYLWLVCENNYKKVSVKLCLKLGLLGNTLQGGVSWGVHWLVSVGKWGKRIKQWMELNCYYVLPGAQEQEWTSESPHVEARGALYPIFIDSSWIWAGLGKFRWGHSAETQHLSSKVGIWTPYTTAWCTVLWLSGGTGLGYQEWKGTCVHVCVVPVSVSQSFHRRDDEGNAFQDRGLSGRIEAMAF